MTREIPVKMRQSLTACAYVQFPNGEEPLICKDELERIGYDGLGEYTLFVTPGRGQKIRRCPLVPDNAIRTAKGKFVCVTFPMLGLKTPPIGEWRRVLLRLVKKESKCG